MNGDRMLTAANPAPEAVPPGWYTDPLAPGDVRWWTGEDWTHHVQPRPVVPQVELVDARGY